MYLNPLPFSRLPATMIIKLGNQVVFWLNAFPALDGTSNTLSPCTIVTGLTLNHDRHCSYEYVKYVQTHEEHDNSMASRTVGALTMRPTGNAHRVAFSFSA